MPPDPNRAKYPTKEQLIEASVASLVRLIAAQMVRDGVTDSNPEDLPHAERETED
jgi:hypothetical protein